MTDTLDLGLLIPEPVAPDDNEYLGDIPQEEYDQPDPKFLKAPRRANHAAAYEQKLTGFFNTAFRFAVAHEATVPDAAALFMHGPQMAKVWGDAAASDKRIATAIDFFTTPTESPISAAIMATVPFIMQALRNHEPQVEAPVRGIKLPFSNKRIPIKFGVKFRRLRPLTNDPDALAKHVFQNPDVVESLNKQGISVAGYIRASQD